MICPIFFRPFHSGYLKRLLPFYGALKQYHSLLTQVPETNRPLRSQVLHNMGVIQPLHQVSAHDLRIQHLRLLHQKECDFLLTKEKELKFVITPLDGKHVQTKVITLSVPQNHPPVTAKKL